MNRKTQKKKRFFRVRVVLGGLFLGILFGLLMLWGVYQKFSRDLPTLNSLADYQPNLLTRVYARDYQLLGEFFAERRQFVPIADVPPVLIKALLAIEDTAFYEHWGINPRGMARAALANLSAGRVVQGASTITQQVAKTFLLSSERTWVRKVKEIILALRIEERLTKDEILELYLNQIFLGAGAYGVGAAARVYFNRDVADLELGQMAMLAGLPQQPSRYNPWKHPERARKRQALVLRRMAGLGYISREEADAAIAAPLGLAKAAQPLEAVASHYLEHVRRTIAADWGMGNLLGGGLDVFTTLDPPLQRVAQAALRRGLLVYDRRHGYRGPLERIEGGMTAEVREKWLAANKNVEPTAGGFLRGLVVAVAAKGAAKVLLTDAREIELPLEGVTWARRRLKAKNKPVGPPVKAVSEVLAVGDVILVEPPKAASPDAEAAAAAAAAAAKSDLSPAEIAAAAAEAAVAKGRPYYMLAQEPDVGGALVSIDPHNGQILAMVGGYDFSTSEFNRATQGWRQPGSAFKPFIYAAAMAKGLPPTTIVDDSPISFQSRNPATGAVMVWRPENYEQKFYGPTTLRVGLEHSRNLVTIRLLERLTLDFTIPFVGRFGLEIPDSRRNLTLALGTVVFTPLKMASAYAVFANGGKFVEPVYIARIQDRLGRTIFRHGGGDCLLCHQEPKAVSAADAAIISADPLTKRRVLTPATAYQMVSLLKGVVERGTARKALVLKRPLAGKTGTTNDLRDAWFIGFSPSLVAAVWVGADDYSELGHAETGAMVALPIWIDFMREALKDIPVTDFPVPPGIHFESVSLSSGGPGSGSGSVLEAFQEGQGPNQGSSFPSSGDSETTSGGASPGGESSDIGDGLY
ncbi:MAG: PBP1A family penicillin-binding protein [Magnetococcales bacterium]|nr:PBP1A family penicillin-binding protein [Magnetococcales bacterium]